MSDPAKQPRPLSSLSEAFTCLHMPFENRRIVEAYTRAIGITTYLERSSYVIANRRDGGPALRIGYGWADGFIDANEIRSILGETLDIWQSDDRAPLWGLWHPINKARTGTAHSNRQRASADAACPHCGSMLPLSGICDFC